MLKQSSLKVWPFLCRHLNLYRIITGLGFLGAMVLVLLTPVQMPDPDDWAYYYGVEKFSDGQFTVNNYSEYTMAKETNDKGNMLIQYLPIAYDKWALEKAPGYVFYMIPFQKAGIPRYGNVVLALGMVIVTYLLLKRLRDEKTAMIGSFLTLFTPIALVMLNRIYMDTYGSLAFLVIGAGLYFYYHLERSRLGRISGGALLFLGFFFTGWSVVTRYTNLPIAVILFLHLVITRWLDWRKGEKRKTILEIAPVFLGIALPVLALALYDYFVFGSPFTYGYKLSPFPIKFAFQYLGQVDAGGESIPAQIFRYNAEGFRRNLLIGFPLMLIAVPAFIAVLYFKLADSFKRLKSSPRWASLSQELPWDFLAVLIGWFVFVFVLYLAYEWTAGLKEGGGFVLLNRFMLPGLFPLVVTSALILARFSFKVFIPVLAVLLGFGGTLYAQWALNWHILPAFLTLRVLDSRWPGYVFPPWVKYPPADSGGPYFPWHIWPNGAGPFLTPPPK